jgi:hypothetical protein
MDLYLRTQYSSTYGRPITYLMDGRCASRGAFVELFLFIPRPHSFSCGAPCCNPAHRDGMGSGG